MDEKGLDLVTAIYDSLNKYLDEKHRRLFLGATVHALGPGALKAICQRTGVAKDTVIRGKREVRGEIQLQEKGTRKRGGGRKRLEDKYPELLEVLEGLVGSKGGEKDPFIYTSKSLVKLVAELEARNYKISDNTVLRLLHKLGYSLSSTKLVAGPRDHPKSHEQFLFINRRAKEYMQKGQPVLSIEAKEKEEESLDLSLPQLKGPSSAKGRGGELTPLALELLVYWWKTIGSHLFPKAQGLMVAMDFFRGNIKGEDLKGYFKGIGLPLLISSIPIGTYRWRRVEQRFSTRISIENPGQLPLIYEVVMHLISSPREGLKGHDFHGIGEDSLGEWNSYIEV